MTKILTSRIGSQSSNLNRSTKPLQSLTFSLPAAWRPLLVDALGILGLAVLWLFFFILL